MTHGQHLPPSANDARAHRPTPEITGVFLARFVRSVAVLALPAGGQLRWIAALGFAPEAATADELVVDFDDGMRLLPEFLANGWLRQAEVDRLVVLARLLSDMGGHGNGQLWTMEALRSAREWEAVRIAALEALLTI